MKNELASRTKYNTVEQSGLLMISTIVECVQVLLAIGKHKYNKYIQE